MGEDNVIVFELNTEHRVRERQLDDPLDFYGVFSWFADRRAFGRPAALGSAALMMIPFPGLFRHPTSKRGPDPTCPGSDWGAGKCVGDPISPGLRHRKIIRQLRRGWQAIWMPPNCWHGCVVAPLAVCDTQAGEVGLAEGQARWAAA